MTSVLSVTDAFRITSEIFQAVGAPRPEADDVAESLVESNLAGHDSHGVIRIPEYLRLINAGTVIPGAPIEVQETSATTAVVHCGLNFGAVGGKIAMQKAIDLAREQKTACVTTRKCNHVGRLGAYVQTAAEAGMIAIATCSSPVHGHYVLPWGGREGRLATNPMGYGIPTAGDPLVADFSTSVAPEGKIRVYRNQEKPLPDGWILDLEGNPSNSPADFYGPPRGGILPLGGVAGHKGYALGLLVDLLGNVLNGVSSTDAAEVGNGVCFVVVDPAAFCPPDTFRSLASETATYMKSSPPAPGFDEVLVPGELEFRTAAERRREGIPIDEPTMNEIRRCAAEHGVAMDAA